MTKSDETSLGCLMWIGILMAFVGSIFLFGPVALIIGGVLFIILALVLMR